MTNLSNQRAGDQWKIAGVTYEVTGVTLVAPADGAGGFTPLLLDCVDPATGDQATIEVSVRRW